MSYYNCTAQKLGVELVHKLYAAQGISGLSTDLQVLTIEPCCLLISNDLQ